MKETSPSPRRERYSIYSFTFPDGREVRSLSGRELRILTALAGGETKSRDELAEILDPKLFASQPDETRRQVYTYISNLNRIKLEPLGLEIKNEVPPSEKRKQQARYRLQKLGGEGEGLGEVVIFKGRSLAIREGRQRKKEVGAKPEEKLRPFALTREQVVALGVVLGVVSIKNSPKFGYNLERIQADLRALHEAVCDSTGNRPRYDVSEDFKEAISVLGNFPKNREAFFAQNNKKAWVVLNYLERFPDGESLQEFLSFLFTEYQSIER